jgi:hypothetical protein
MTFILDNKLVDAKNLPKKGRGRRQEAEGIKYNFFPLSKGFKAPQFIYEKQ